MLYVFKSTLSLMLEKIKGKRRRGMAEDEMVGWHHQFSGRELGQTLGDGEGQESLVCCRPCDRKAADMTEQWNNSSGSVI